MATALECKFTGGVFFLFRFCRPLLLPFLLFFFPFRFYDAALALEVGSAAGDAAAVGAEPPAPKAKAAPKRKGKKGSDPAPAAVGETQG